MSIKTLFLALSILGSLPVWSHDFEKSGFQSNEEIPKQIFLKNKLDIKELPAENEVLSQMLPMVNLGAELAENLLIDHYRVSPEGYHYLFTYHHQGIPCVSRYIRIFVDKQLRVRQVIYLLEDIDAPFLNQFPDTAVLRSKLSAMKKVGAMSLNWIHVEEGWKSVIKVPVIEDLAANAEIHFYDASYHLVHAKRNAFHFMGKDSTVQAKVFDPDPLTHAGVVYGEDYQDFNDADSPAINNQRVWRPIIADFDQGVFYLRDSSFVFAELENPISAPPISNTPVFEFNRSEQEFEFVNAFYHLQKYKSIVRGLGYNLPHMRILVDPHAANGADVAAFTMGFDEPALIFGEGGIDDAEDADVIVHELGHGISFSAAPYTSSGLQRESMEEANCDYFAMSYSRRINPFNWQKTFNWDGNTTSWKGRVANSDKIYPRNYNSNKYSNAEIWVAAWADIYTQLGPDITDKLMLCGMYNQVENMGFSMMVNNILQCDSIQNQAANYQVIFDAFDSRGLTIAMSNGQEINSNDWRLLNTAGFTNAGEPLVLDFGGKEFNGTIEVMDMQGKKIHVQSENRVDRMSIDLPSIASGIYLLRVISNEGQSVTYLINSQY